MKRLSIIVPMYNVEPYVERCLRSLEDQDIPKTEYEIICINDGSPDNSREFIIKMQKKFENIILIDQENQGVSSARNNGIAKAEGKYILFIDPDDYVDSNSFARILRNIEEKEAQVSFLGFTCLNADETIRKQIFYEKLTSQIYIGTETYFLARGDGQTDPDRMVAIIFETKFINDNNLRYLPNVPYLEDGEFISRVLCLAERCIFDGYSFYQRTTRRGSTTNSKLFYSEKSTNGFLLSVSNLKKFQQEHKLNEKQRSFLNQPIVKFAVLAINSSIELGYGIKLKRTVKKLKELNLRRVEIKGCSSEYRMYGKVYNISPYFSAIALIFYPRFKRLYQFSFTQIKS